MMVAKLFLIIIFLFLSPLVCLADTHNAASCENKAGQTDVQTAIDAASNGDTVSVPAGECTWTTDVSIPSTKTIILMGAGSGVDGTVITAGSDSILTIGAYEGSLSVPGTRVTGFRFISAMDNKYSIITVAGKYWRIDHNYFECLETDTLTATATAINANSLNTPLEPWGVVDNNTFINYKIYTSGGSTFAEFGTIWAEDVAVGQGKGVYIEDNILSSSLSTRKQVADSQYAGRYVFRYNTLTNAWIMAHGLQFNGDYRGTKEWEIYGNSFSCSVETVGPALYSGTGIIFSNSGGGDYAWGIILGHYRTDTTYTGSGKCDGTSDWDENTVGQSGWLCRDQIGSGHDASAWTNSGNAAPAQTKLPAYLWSNFDDGVAITVTPQAPHVTANRDFYNYNASFNGTTGTGCGTLDSRPATCTTGVGYWATNQNCSNLTGLVGDSTQRTNGVNTYLQGTLYKCTDTDTWTAYYTPYTYPHPLRGSDTVAPTASAYAINEAGSSFTVTFSERVTHGAGGRTGWVLTSDGGAVTATYSSGEGSTTLAYQLSRTIYSTETVTGTYTQPTAGITDIAANEFATVTDVAITNNSTATSGAPTYPKMTLSTGSNMTLSPSGTGSITLAP